MCLYYSDNIYIDSCFCGGGFPLLCVLLIMDTLWICSHGPLVVYLDHSCASWNGLNKTIINMYGKKKKNRTYRALSSVEIFSHCTKYYSLMLGDFCSTCLNQLELMILGGGASSTVVLYDTHTGFIFDSITALGQMARLVGLCSVHCWCLIVIIVICIPVLFLFNCQTYESICEVMM